MSNKDLVHQELYDGVYYYENVISDPQRLMEVIESTEGVDELQEIIANWVDWGVEADRGTVYWYGKRKRVLLNDLDDIDSVEVSEESRAVCKEIFDTIFDGFRAVCDDYKVKRNIDDEVIVLNQMNVHKYKENTWMGTHHDAQEGDTRLKYSLLLYINDDYKDGELFFRNLDIKLRPKPKTLLIFPGNEKYEHGVETVSDGPIRYVLVGFIKEVDHYERNKY